MSRRSTIDWPSTTALAIAKEFLQRAGKQPLEIQDFAELQTIITQALRAAMARGRTEGIEIDQAWQESTH